MTQRTQRQKRKPARLVLRLYIAGGSPNSVRARENLRAAIAGLPNEDVSLELVDVLREPERALRDTVLVTPTLIRVAPAPEQRVIGNLRDRSVLLAGLGISEAGID
jgi:circadian clock protein KaiB